MVLSYNNFAHPISQKKKKKRSMNRKGQQRAIKMIEGTEIFLYWGRLKTERLLLLFGKKKNWG